MWIRVWPDNEVPGSPTVEEHFSKLKTEIRKNLEKFLGDQETPDCMGIFSVRESFLKVCSTPYFSIIFRFNIFTGKMIKQFMSYISWIPW